MSTFTETWSPTRASSVLIKAGMAVTGAIMAGWLTLHMLGNLLVFAGPSVMNGYGEKLRATGLLWPVRVLLMAATVLHVVCAAITTARGRAARPIAYRALRSAASTLGSRSMRVTGVLLLAYIVYHVASIYGVGHPAFIPSDGHHNLVSLLRIPLHAACYALASAAIALHLSHGLSSAWISLGWVSRSRERLVQRSMRVSAALLTLGFTVTILAPWLGLI